MPVLQSSHQHRSIRVLLFFGAFFLFLTFFKGDGGYHDLVYYLDDAEGLWLRGDMARQGETEEVDLPDGTTVERPVYSQYSLGLAFVSGPFVLLGHALEYLSGGALGARKFAVLIIPVFAAFSALLLFEIGRQLSVAPVASLWAAIIFILGTPILTFARLFYTETAIVFFLLFAIWAFLKTQASAGEDQPLPSPARQLVWSLLAGLGLAAAGACHYAEGVMVGMLWLGMALTFFFARKDHAEPLHPATGGRVLNVVALSAVPLLAVSTIVYVNFLRRGHFLDTGYGSDVGELAAHNLTYNWHYFFWAQETKLKLGLLVRSPWIIPGVAFLWAWPRSPQTIILRRALIVGALLQTVFWMCYAMLGFSPFRYLQPATGALTVALLCLGQWIYTRKKGSGLIFVGVLLIAWNLWWFFSGDDRNLPLLTSPENHELLIYSWYMRPFANGLTDGYGTPPGLVQWLTLGALVSAGAACLTRAALVLSCEDL